jgi:flavin reductase (DIM6/NTAB) family NADH-FMN oxidoreductase RutF
VTVDGLQFRQAMAQFASGVTVVTTTRDGKPYGLTASSFASLSLDPPLVLVCLSRTLSTYEIIEGAGAFAVNILSSHQLEVARRFAGLHPSLIDRFDEVEWTPSKNGSPLLPGCLAWVDCRIRNIYDGGDHSIFVGAVEDAGVTGVGDPLLYHNRLWGRGLFGE